jgi:hypothetical protein
LTEPLTLNTIEQLARALFAQLSPITGGRSTGALQVTAEPGADAVLSRNAYLAPVVGGQYREELLFKVAANPATPDGSWPIAAGATELVAITSNIGGTRQNVVAAPGGTVFRFDPPQPGLLPAALLLDDLAGGDDSDQLVRGLAAYEDLDSANPAIDAFAAKLTDLPALMLVWMSSTPVEGTTAGLRRGSSRQGRNVVIMREAFTLYVLVGNLVGDSRRRQLGSIIMQAATRLLTDRIANLDGETLSSIGAVEIGSRTRLRRGAGLYIYALQLRTSQTLTPIETREFAPWLRTAIHETLPGHEAPEPTDPIEVVDVEEPMS